MSFSPTSGQVVLKEVFDEGSVPTEEEIYDYALRIGIDVESEPHLLYLARDGLMQALPSGWKPCYDKDKKEIYYFNFKTKKAQWEHPLDDIYRNLVKKARNESAVSDAVDDDSRTSIKEDLKSFEEASLILTANDMYNKPKKLEPLSPLGKSILKKMPSALSPIKKCNSRDLSKMSILKPALHIDENLLHQKSENEESLKKGTIDEMAEVRKRPNSSDIRNRRNIGPMEFRHLSKQEIINPQALEKFNFLTETKKLFEGKGCSESPSEAKGTDSNVVTRDEGYGTEFSVSSLGEKDGSGKKELTLAGGGSVFLKSNKTKFSPSSDLVTSSFSREELSEGLLSPDTRKPVTELDSHIKSILRDQNTQKTVEKVPAASDKKFRKEDTEDDRKSVRFNLEKELKISFEIPSVAKSEADSLSASIEKNNSSRSDKIPFSGRERQESRQIEVDFDDLDICLSDDKPEKVMEEAKVPNEALKTAEPKKFKPSQMLVNEFREILDPQPKNNIKLMEFTKGDNSKTALIPKSSRSSTSSVVSGTSQSEENPQSLQKSKSDALENGKKEADKNEELAVTAKDKVTTSHVDKLSELGLVEQPKPVEEKPGGKIFDSAFNELVDFAIKKKLDIESSSRGGDTPRSKISYQEKDFLLEQILKGNDSDSAEEDESAYNKLFISQEKELEYLENLESQINLKAQRRKELEEDIGNTEKMRNEKLNELEKEYKMWLKDVEESYAEKKKETSNNLKKQYQTWMKQREEEFEKLYKEKYEEEAETKIKAMKNEMTKKENFEMEKLKSQFEEEQKERLKRFKQEWETQESNELDALRKSFEDSLNEKKAELMKKHKEEISKIERSLEDFLSEQKSQKLKELEMVRENETVIEAMRLEMKESYQKQKNALMKEHEFLLENLKREHASAVEKIKSEFRNDEELLKKLNLNRLEEIKMNSSQGTADEKKAPENVETPKSDIPEARVFEKVRSEKRLLEDKYKTLKEKYIKLKTEAKSTLERKKKKKESSVTTGSEPENCSSHKLESEVSNMESPGAQRKQTDKEKKLKKQMNHLEYLYQDFSTEDEENLMSPKNLSYLQRSLGISHFTKKQQKNEDKHLKSPASLDKSKEDLSGGEKKLEGQETKKKRQLFSRFKAVSTSRINSSTKGKEVLSPVENLRRQLKKLEELEDQFPVTTYTDTYMRYPFTDNAQFGSSEIEFFKHRIHLERESVRRAKDTLKAQKKSFETRQRELKQKLIEGEPGSKALIDQIYQEEKELTDMEVSVYRTRALLGEKIIRLRHLEQSLKRISQPIKKGKDFLERLGVRNQSKEDEKTLSDLSSYSGSSGFSSTDFNDVNNAVGVLAKKSNLEQSRRHFQNNMQESTEIIQSLENLNSEIREIWEVLKKQHQSGQETITMLPPPPLIYGDIGWSGFTLSPPLPFRNTVITSTSNLQRPVAQQFRTQVTGASNLRHVSTIIDSTLIDRTKSLRDWLKAARNSAPSEAISHSSQVTL